MNETLVLITCAAAVISGIVIGVLATPADHHDDASIQGFGCGIAFAAFIIALATWLYTHLTFHP